MNGRRGLFLLIAPLAFTLASCQDKAESEKAEQERKEQMQQANDEQEIRKQIQRYIEAINQRKVDQIPEFWSPTSVYRNPVTGDLVQGRDGIKKEFQKVFDHFKDFKVQFNVETIRFPVDGKSSEEGTTVLTISGRDPIVSPYKMKHVKQDGKWLIMHVSQIDFGMVNKPK